MVKMKTSRSTLLVLLAAASAALSSTAASAQATPQLQSVLSQMDAASAKFKSAEATFQWDFYERIVHDTTTQTGSIYFLRNGSTTDMGALVLDAGAKAPQVIEYKAGKIQLFNPGPDQITVINAQANQAEYESFLTLGFGGSGSDLAKAWNIADMGPETLTDDGKPVKCEKLQLTGKTPEARKNFDLITIWVDPTRAISLKQIFHTPTGNYRTATYSHIKLNSSIDKGKFAIKRDKNTTTITH
jgi:outer membrane lipoprotein-sorting protein